MMAIANQELVLALEAIGHGIFCVLDKIDGLK